MTGSAAIFLFLVERNSELLLSEVLKATNVVSSYSLSVPPDPSRVKNRCDRRYYHNSSQHRIEDVDPSLLHLSENAKFLLLSFFMYVLGTTPER